MPWTTQPRQRLPRSAAGRHRRGAAAAPAGARLWLPADQHAGHGEQRAVRRDSSRGARLCAWCRTTIRSIVFARPRPGYRPLVAIRYGYSVPIGVYFQPWGWGGNRIVWSSRTVIRRTWERVRANRDLRDRTRCRATPCRVRPSRTARWRRPRASAKQDRGERSSATFASVVRRVDSPFPPYVSRSLSLEEVRHEPAQVVGDQRASTRGCPCPPTRRRSPSCR